MPKILYSFHSHAESNPYPGGLWCRSFDRWSDHTVIRGALSPSDMAREQAREFGGVVVGPIDFGQSDCPYPQEKKHQEKQNVAKARTKTAAVVAPVEPEMEAWHVHTDTEPYCRSWHQSKSGQSAQSRAEAAAVRYDGQLVGPLSFTSVNCDFKAELEAEATAEPEPETEEDEVSNEEFEDILEEIEEEQEPEPAPRKRGRTAKVAAVVEPEPEEEEELEEELVDESENEASDDDGEEPEEETEDEEEDETEDEPEDEELLEEEDETEDEPEDEELLEEEDEDEEEEPEPTPRKRGRPAKAATVASATVVKPVKAPSPIAATAKPVKAARVVAPPEPAVVKAKSGRTVDLHELSCSGCGGTLDSHKCPSQRNATGATRKAATDHAACPHCGGRMHWNSAGATINFECLYRQYLLDTGKIEDPNERLPIFTTVDAKAIGSWVRTKEKAGEEILYGKMDSASGGAATYSALRSATARAAKAAEPEAAPKGKRVEDMAAKASPVATAEAEPDKPKRKSKAEKEAEAAAAKATQAAELKAKKKALLTGKKK